MAGGLSENESGPRLLKPGSLGAGAWADALPVAFEIRSLRSWSN